MWRWFILHEVQLFMVLPTRRMGNTKLPSIPFWRCGHLILHIYFSRSIYVVVFRKGCVRQNTAVFCLIYYSDDDMFRPLWAIFRSQKCVKRRTIQCMFISNGAYAPLLMNIHCIVLLFIHFCDLKMAHSGRNMSSSSG